MNGLNQYKSYQVSTVAAEDQIALLYDGARRFADLAQVALTQKDYAGVSLNTGKAQRILSELQACLNFEGGEVAHNLDKLYEYWIWRLSQGLINKDAEAFAEVSRWLDEYSRVWTEAARQIRAQKQVQALG